MSKIIPSVPGWVVKHNFNFQRNPLTFMRQLQANYGDIMAITPQHIFVFSPAYTQTLLSQPDVFQTVTVPFPTPAKSALARLFTIPGQMNGPQNKHQRQVMLTSLHKKYYERYYQGIRQVLKRHLACWQIGQSKEMLAEMNTITLKTPCQAIFGLNPEAEGRNFIKLLDAWGQALIAPQTSLWPYKIKGMPYQRLLDVSEALEAEYWHLVEDCRGQGLPTHSPLSYLIQQYDAAQLTQAELIGQINNLFNAGNTSRAAVLAWAMFLLSQYPDYLAQVRAELARTLQSNIPTQAELAHLPLLEACLKETMRLLPPVSWLSRWVIAETELDGYPLPQGATVICSPFVVQRNPEIYPQPDCFWPERWLTTSHDVYAYLPFGAGSRACVGQNLALFEMKLILATLLQRYQLKPQAHTPINSTGVMVSAPQTMPMRLLPRYSPLPQAVIQGNIRQLLTLPN